MSRRWSHRTESEKKFKTVIVDERHEEEPTSWGRYSEEHYPGYGYKEKHTFYHYPREKPIRGYHEGRLADLEERAKLVFETLENLRDDHLKYSAHERMWVKRRDIRLEQYGLLIQKSDFGRATVEYDYIRELEHRPDLSTAKKLPVANGDEIEGKLDFGDFVLDFTAARPPGGKGDPRFDLDEFNLLTTVYYKKLARI